MTDDAGGPLAATRAWLAARADEVPEVLTDAVDAALERAARAEARPAHVRPPSDSVPDFLAYTAVCELEGVAREEHDRELAVRLLAADACLTWAFEAAAERGTGEELERLAEANGLRGRIGDLLRRLEAEERP